jgi:hypothetical protein
MERKNIEASLAEVKDYCFDQKPLANCKVTILSGIKLPEVILSL